MPYDLVSKAYPVVFSSDNTPSKDLVADSESFPAAVTILLLLKNVTRTKSIIFVS